MEDKSNLEKKVLFVDDQWGKENDFTIKASYGSLQKLGYILLKEDAFDGTNYSIQKVISRIDSEKSINAVILDLDFTSDYGSDRYFEGQKLGIKILRSLVSSYPNIPVIMHSSNESKTVIQKCLDIGAKDYLQKKATLKEMKEALDKHIKKL